MPKALTAALLAVIASLALTGNAFASAGPAGATRSAPSAATTASALAPAAIA